MNWLKSNGIVIIVLMLAAAAAWYVYNEMKKEKGKDAPQTNSGIPPLGGIAGNYSVESDTMYADQV